MELVVFLQFYAMLILLALLFIVFKFPQNHQQVEGSGSMYIVIRRRGGEGEGSCYKKLWKDAGISNK